MMGIIVWICMKALSLIGKIGIRIADQDGDGKLDKKDFELAINKVSDFFSSSKTK